jgi:invasion protein IalB
MPGVQGEVKSDMRQFIFPSTTLGQVRTAGALAAALMLGITVLLAPAGAQQPPPAKKDATPAAKAPAAAPAQKAPAAAAPGKAAPATPPAGSAQSAWVKLCEKATATQKTKDGKDEKKDLNICLTHHERLDGNSGMVLISAAVRQVEGQDKQAFMVMVPLGMMLQPGMRATLYPKDMWDKAQKNEKVDESKLKPISLAYTLCHPAGCTCGDGSHARSFERPEKRRWNDGFRHQRRRCTRRLPGAAGRLRAVLCRSARRCQKV